MEINEFEIFPFSGKYKLAKYPPKEEGYYMTIRCGRGGIYTNLDEWKNSHWQVGILDDSCVIAYSRELLYKEQVNQYCQIKLNKRADAGDIEAAESLRRWEKQKKHLKKN